jgi:hypothetical protein
MTREELERFVGELISISGSDGEFWRGLCLVSLDEERVCFYDGDDFEWNGKHFEHVNIQYDDVEFFEDPEGWVEEYWGKEILHEIMRVKDNPPKGFKATIGKSFVKDGMVQNPFTGRWSWL